MTGLVTEATNTAKEESPIDREAKEEDRYRVRRGEPGRNVVTPLRDGQPVIENPPALSESSPSSSLPAVISEEKEPVLLSHADEVAHYHYIFITRFLEGEVSQRGKPTSEIIGQFLSAYNSGHLLPEVYKKLKHVSRAKLYKLKKAYIEDGIKGLTPKTDRKSISVITEHERNLLLALVLHQNRLKIGFAIRLTKYILAQKRIPSPSCERTLRRYVEQFKCEHNDLWTLSREGEKALDDKLLPYIERDREQIEVGEGLVADGHKLNFQVIDDCGKARRATMVLFWDWRSSYPCGWEIMFSEDTQCIATALRNSILTLGKIPKWVLIDNGKAFKADVFTSEINLSETEIKGIFAHLNINTHFAWPYNAKAKPIERFFGIFNEWFERLMPSFTGASIEDKPAYLKRNEKLARSLHDPWIPKILEVNDLMYKWREFYADQPSKGLNGKTPREVFDGGKGPGIDPAELVYLMMAKEIRTIHRNGVTFLGRNWYNEALYGYGDKVTIKYSLSDLSQIYIFDSKGDFICAAKPRERVHPMASESGTPKDMEDVKRQIAQKRSLKSQTVKLYKLLGKKQQQLPWKEIIDEVPGVVETIEKIEAEKPKTKFISPFSEIPGEKSGSPDESIINVNPKTGLTCPALNEKYEIYEWYRKRDLETLNARDREWIRKYESSEEWAEFYASRGRIAIPSGDDQTEGDFCVAQEEGVKTEIAADDGSVLSCPRLNSAWEMYEWYYLRDPNTHRIIDLGWIDWHEDGYHGKHFGSDPDQRHFRHLLSKRPGEAEYDIEGGEIGRDYRLGCDPGIVRRWRDIKDSIIIDPVSGLSRPAEGLPPDDERTWYEFCRGIEKRFPGTLTNADWDKMEKYQATREWELIFRDYEIYRLYRPVTE